MSNLLKIKKDDNLIQKINMSPSTSDLNHIFDKKYVDNERKTLDINKIN